MADGSLISAARTALFDALTAELADWPWRVHRVTPAQIVAPSVYIDSHETNPDPPFTTITFPVVMVVDGLERRQVEQLDDLDAHIQDAAYRAEFVPADSRPFALDVGGPSLRAQAVRVEHTVTARTLCIPELVITGGTP